MLPILVAAPSTAAIEVPRAKDGLSLCPCLIDESPVLSDTPASAKAISLGAPSQGISPSLIATLIHRLCKGGSPRGLVVAPYDKYGILAAGAALAQRDFVGLCPISPEEGSGLDVEKATNNYIQSFLKGSKISARLASDTDHKLWGLEANNA